jgi:hypothetical protein
MGRAAAQMLAAEYGVDIDYESVPRLCDGFGLVFGTAI